MKIKESPKPFSHRDNVSEFIEWGLLDIKHVIIDGIDIKILKKEEVDARREAAKAEG